MSDPRPRLFWFRRDLRLGDHPGLSAAAEGGPVVPVFVLDPETERLGAAARWRLGLGLEALARRLEAAGSRLILRRGPALEALRGLATETGAGAVHWSRLYAPDWMARDRVVKAGLTGHGIVAISHPGHLLREPWQIETREGGGFRVFAPFWKALATSDPGPLLAPPTLAPPAVWPRSDRLADWRLGAAMRRGPRSSRPGRGSGRRPRSIGSTRSSTDRPRATPMIATGRTGKRRPACRKT